VPDSAPDQTAASRLPRALRPFGVREYRLLAVALGSSLFGGGVWIIAIVGTVFALDGTPGDLSLVATGTAVGMLVAALFGGAAADRIPQRRILLTVEIARTVAIAAVAALALTGRLELWHLAVGGVVLGLAEGAFYPAYSALLPRVLPADQLLAANGVEGMLRPIASQAAGPAVASLAILLGGPGLAFLIIGLTQLLAIGCLAAMRGAPLDRASATGGAVRGFVADIGGGIRTVVGTPWLIATLLYASVVILLVVGPFDVLVPFAVRDQAGGGEAAFALVLAMYGVGGAVGSFVVASLRLPRRYLTVMNVVWTLGCLPMAVFGLVEHVWVFVVLAFVMGLCGDSANVLWGTILQRRVPKDMLGRVSSLDFFVSVSLLPVSMALAGPVADLVGLGPVFLVAGLAPVVLAVVAILAARMHVDELAHPLDDDRIEPDAQEILGPGAPIHG